MKYKVGDKFLIPIEVTRIDEKNRHGFHYEMSDSRMWVEEALNKLLRPDDMTAEEAWEMARKIICGTEDGGYSTGDLKEIFGTCNYGKIMYENTYQEAKAKIEAWEAEQKIKVGDVVRNVQSPEIEVIITKHYYHDGDYYDGINSSGAVYSSMRKKDWKKTGRHIDIQGLLSQIGET